MTSLFDFDAPQFMDRRETNPADVDNFFAQKEAIEKSKIETFPAESATKMKRKPKVSFFAEEKENMAGKYSLSNRLTTPKPKKEIHDLGHDDDDLLLKIDNLMIDSTRKQRKTFNVFEGITLAPTSEKKHRMQTRTDSLTRTPVLELRNRSVLRAIETDEDETDDSMVSAVSSTSTCNTYELPARKIQQYEEPTTSRTASSALDFGRFTMDTQSWTFKKAEKRKSDSFSEKSTKFISLAEQVINFHKATPDRFRSKPLPWKKPMLKPATLYVPMPPKLTAMTRTRAVHYLGHEHQEQQEYEDMQKYQIKARPINEKIMKGVSLGLAAPINPRHTTQVQPFNLTEFKPKPPPKEEVFKFEARPLPTKILEKPVGIPPKIIRPPTTPKTPAIVMQRRVRVSPLSSKDNSLRSSTESLAMQRTAVQPFSFHERDKLALAKKDQLIKKVLADEKKTFSSFKAQPVKHYTSLGMTPKKAAQPKKTEPVPFNLTKPGQFAGTKTVEPEVKVEFKAQPASVLKRRPFMPQHERSATPKPIPFNLKTNERPAQRKKFEEQLKEKTEQQDKFYEKIRIEEEERKEQEMKEMRKKAEFKAQPVPKNRPFQIQESQMPLTDPKTPPFHFHRKNQAKDNS